MTNTYFTDNDIDSSETLEWVKQPHFASEIGSILMGVVLLPFFGLGLLVLVNSYVNLNYKAYAMTDKALYLKKGLLSKSVQRVPLHKIQNSSYSQSFLEQQYGYGTVEISTAGSGTGLQFRAIEGAEEIQRTIADYIGNKSSSSEPTSQTDLNEEVAKELRATRKALEELAEERDK